MSAKADNLGDSYSEQLSEFDIQLRNRSDTTATIPDLTGTIKRLLLGNADSESDIRGILHKRLQDGHIHDDTFRLVLGVLDGFVSEEVPTIPGVVPQLPGQQDHIDRSGIAAAPSTPPVLVDGQVPLGYVLRDRFQLEERVASGGMGVVYKALDRRLAEAGGLEPWVAIKLLNTQLASNPNAVRALQQEAAKGRCLSHPNIVRFVDIDRHDDMYFIVMEWLEGRSLANILEDGKGKSINQRTALEIVSQIGQALDYAQRCGVVHADVKPANIMVTPSGAVKLIDFGIARIRQQSEAEPGFDPAVLGSATPAYSSMQVLTGETPVPADDVFSLGCLMYRLIAGYRVFGPRNAAEAAAEGMAPQRPRELGDNEWRVLKKSLAFARVARFPSARDFLDALAVKPGIRVSPDDTLSAVPQLPKRRPWGLLVLATIAITGALAVTRPDIVERARTMLSDALPTSVTVNPVASEDFAVADQKLSVPAVNETIAATDSVALTDAPISGTDLRDDQPDGAAVLTEELAPSEAIDFAKLPPATMIIPLGSVNSLPVEVSLTLIEDGEDAIVDLVRESKTELPLSVDFDEVGFTGNRSPLAAGEYRIADNGVVQFVAGQTRARAVISMDSNPLREPDRVVTLLLRDGDSVNSELATIKLRLEDDDQRAFEAGLDRDTVAFAVSRVSVRESDPAAQVDIIRFNPGSAPLDVDYTIRGVTATNGEDFFEPRFRVVSFGPGQRSARILIPLVQDSLVEADEAFMLELTGNTSAAETDLFRRIAVMIRDDDSPGR